MGFFISIFMTVTEITNLALSHLGSQYISDYTTDNSQVGPIVRLWFDTARDECLRSHPWNFATKRARLTTTYSDLSGTAITNSGGLIKITYTAHGLVTGERILLQEVEGINSINQNWYITRIDADNFTLDDSVFASGYTADTGKFVKVPVFDWSYEFTPPTDMLRLVSLDTIGDEFNVENGKILANSSTILIKYVYQCTDTTLWPKDFINTFSFLLASYIAKGISSDSEFNFRDIYEKMIAPLTKIRDSREAREILRNRTSQSNLVNARAGII